MKAPKPNPVQKNLWKFNKKKVHKDKTKYDRKGKWGSKNKPESE